MKRAEVLFMLIMLLLCGSCSVHEEMIALPPGRLALEEKEDGTYPGSWEKYRWFCDVEVDITSHRIDTIRVLRAANGGKKFYGELITRVVDQQSVEVDAVSGGTISSNAFFKAVEEALE